MEPFMTRLPMFLDTETYVKVGVNPGPGIVAYDKVKREAEFYHNIQREKLRKMDPDEFEQVMEEFTQ